LRAKILPGMKPGLRLEPGAVADGKRYDSLQALLDNLREAGVDSEGRFTLNPARARELLEQFQLPDPAYYVLHLMSFLVGSGARELKVSSSRSELRMEAPGASINKESLANPFSVLLRSGAEAYQAELALGLNAILGQSGGRATLRYDRWTARYTPQSVEVEEAEQAVPSMTIACSPRCSRQGKDRELELLRESFRWCPVPVRINGNLLPDPSSTYPAEGLQILLHNPDFPVFCEPAPSNRITKTIQAPFSALIRLGRFKSGFRIIFLGREYPRVLPWGFMLPGWQVDVTIASDRFKKDLSQQSILENELYTNLMTSLRVQLERASELLLTHFPPWTGSEELVDDLLENLYGKGQRELVYAYQQRLVEHLALSENSLQKGRAIYRMALLEKASGHRSHQRLTLATNLLQGLTRLPRFEPQWSILKAEMAFDLDPRIESQVQGLVNRVDTPDFIKEHCYRWLMGVSGQSAKSRAWHRLSLAACIFRVGRLDEALTEVDLAESEAEPFPMEDHQALVIELKAKIAVESGHLEKALELFGRHLSMLRESHGQYDLRLGLTLTRLAKLLEHAGQKKQAREYLAWSRRLHA